MRSRKEIECEIPGWAAEEDANFYYREALIYNRLQLEVLLDIREMLQPGISYPRPELKIEVK